MSDSAPPPYGGPSPYGPPPGRRTPLSSICTRFFNWVHDLGVAANVAVPVDDLRPRAKDVQITLDAVDDIRFCEKLFDKWMAELDKVPSGSKKPDGREQTLRFYLGRLKEQAGLCSNTTNEILQRHVLFASLMAQRIEDASESRYTVNAGPETTARELAKDISKTSGFLSTNVNKMTLDLGSFVSTLEKIQVKVEKGRTLSERILRCDSRVRGRVLSDTALGQAASVFRVMDSEGNESESFDSVIRFLKEIVPNDARNAQEKLNLSDEPLKIMERMRAGQQVALCGSDAAAVAKEWRDVGEQYQSAFGRT